MTEPQVWTLIGVFGALMAGGHAVLIAMMRAQISGLRNEMIARFATVDARFEAVDAKFDRVMTKLEHLDRDVQHLMNREFGGERT
ncbi:MAG: hypothetical protein KF680_09100 [Cryobacterium sp.]|nr:hypothetical protein [Cryobacterium sp.]